jgi:hypothetical protein
MSRPALGPILSPSQWYLDSFPGVKQLGHDADHSPPSRAEVKVDCSHTSTSLNVLHGMGRDFTFTFMFTIADGSE